MDDRNFDEQTALDWIKAVEKPGNTWRDEHVYAKLNGLIHNSLAKTIVDIGCGQGLVCEKLDLKSCKYIGVEPSPYLLNRAEQLYLSTKRTFVAGNAYDLPLKNSSADVAFSILVWHLLMDLEKAVSELSRILTNDRRFLIVTANPAAYLAWKSFYPDAKLNGKRLQGTRQMGDALSRDVLYLHTLKEIEIYLFSAGLSSDSTEEFLPANNFPNQNLLLLIQGKKLDCN